MKAGVKITNMQLNKLNSSAKDKTGITLRITKKIFQADKLPHESLLIIRQKTK